MVSSVVPLRHVRRAADARCQDLAIHIGTEIRIELIECGHQPAAAISIDKQELSAWSDEVVKLDAELIHRKRSFIWVTIDLGAEQVVSRLRPFVVRVPHKLPRSVTQRLHARHTLLMRLGATEMLFSLCCLHSNSESVWVELVTSSL